MLNVSPTSIGLVEIVVQKMSGALQKKKFEATTKRDTEQNNFGTETALLGRLFSTMDDAHKQQAAAVHGLTPKEVESRMDVDQENESLHNHL